MAIKHQIDRHLYTNLHTTTLFFNLIKSFYLANDFIAGSKSNKKINVHKKCTLHQKRVDYNVWLYLLNRNTLYVHRFGHFCLLKLNKSSTHFRSGLYNNVKWMYINLFKSRHATSKKELIKYRATYMHAFWYMLKFI